MWNGKGRKQVNMWVENKLKVQKRQRWCGKKFGGSRGKDRQIDICTAEGQMTVSDRTNT